MPHKVPRRPELLPIATALLTMLVFVWLSRLLRATLYPDPEIVALCALASRPRWGTATVASCIDAVTTAVFVWGSTLLCLTCALAWQIASNALFLRRLWDKLDTAQRSRLVILPGAIGVFAAAAMAGNLFAFAGSGGDTLISAMDKKLLLPASSLILCANSLALVAILLSASVAYAAVAASGDHDIHSVASSTKICILSLYGAAALLTVGHLEISALYRCGAIAMDPFSTSPTPLAGGIAISAGLLFTLLLAAIYGPAAMLLHERLDKITSAQAWRVKDLDVPKWLATHGIKSSPLPTIGAILAPMVAGVVTSLVKPFA